MDVPAPKLKYVTNHAASSHAQALACTPVSPRLSSTLYVLFRELRPLRGWSIRSVWLLRLLPSLEMEEEEYSADHRKRDIEPEGVVEREVDLFLKRWTLRRQDPQSHEDVMHGYAGGNHAYVELGAT